MCLPGQRQVPFDDQRAWAARAAAHGARRERDRRAAQDLGVDRAADLGAVLVGQRLEATEPLAHLQRARVGGQPDRRPGRIARQLHRRLPVGDLDDEIMADLGAHALAVGLDLEGCVLRAELKGLRDAHWSKVLLWAPWVWPMAWQ